MEMTRRLLNLKSVPQPDDAADALALPSAMDTMAEAACLPPPWRRFAAATARGKPITYKEKKT